MGRREGECGGVLYASLYLINVCARNPQWDYARIAIAFGQEGDGKEEGVPVDASGLLGTAAEGVVEVDDGLHLAEAVTELGELRLQE